MKQNPVKISKEKLLLKIIKIISEHSNIDEIKKIIVSELCIFFEADRCHIRYFDAEVDSLIKVDADCEYLSTSTTKSLANIIPENFIFGVFKKLFKNKEPLILRNPNTLQNYSGELLDTIKKLFEIYNFKSAYAFPLFKFDLFMGVLVLGYEKKALCLDDEQIECLRLIAETTSLSLYQAKLYEKEKQTTQREQLLRKIIETIRSSLDINEVIHSFVFEMGQLLGATRTFYSKYDSINGCFLTPAENEEYLLYPNFKSYKELGKTFEKAYPFFKQSLKLNGEIIIIPNREEFVKQHNLEQTPDAQTLREYNIEAVIIVPVIYQEILLGGYAIAYNTPQFFSQETVDFIKTIAAQSAIAIYQAKLYEKEKQTAEREKVLNKITQTIKSNLNIEEILLVACNELTKYYKTPKIIIAYFENSSQSIEIIQQNSLQNFNYNKILNDKNFYDLLFNNNFEILIEDISNSDLPEEFKNKFKNININTFVLIPIKVTRQRIKGIFIFDEKNHNFMKEKEFLQKFADQISLALKQSDIYTQTQFVSNVSHELKTPIAISKAYTEAILSKDISGENFENSLKTILNNIERIDSIINNLLYLSRLQQKLEKIDLDVQKTDIKNLISDAIDSCSIKAIEKNIKIIFDCKEDYFYAKVNPVLFQQAIVNLINNAISYSEVAKTIEIFLVQKKSNLVIKIKDNGIGIEQKYLNNIFERFYRIDKSRSRESGGTGLGLSIVKLIIEAHKCKLRVKSKPNKGSSFYIHIPENSFKKI